MSIIGKILTAAFTVAALAQLQAASVGTGCLTLRLQETVGLPSWREVEISNATGTVLVNGTYDTFCGRITQPIFRNEVYTYSAFSVQDPAVAILGLVATPANLNAVEFILNQIYQLQVSTVDGLPFTPDDIQVAIWTLLDGSAAITPINLGSTTNFTQVHVNEIVTAALANGNFEAACGQIQAYVLNPVSDYGQCGIAFDPETATPRAQPLVLGLPSVCDPDPLQLQCVPVTAGQVGTPYTSQLVAGGGTPGYTFSITAGSVPPGLELNTITGVINGTPTVAGSFDFTATVFDSAGAGAVQVANANCTISIAQPACVPGLIGGIDLRGIVDNYLFFFANGSQDANWQGATKGFVGNVVVDGGAKYRTSGGVPFAGTIYTGGPNLGVWQNIVNQNAGQAFASYGNGLFVDSLKTKLDKAFTDINALPATAGYAGVSAASLNGLNVQDGVATRYVINVTSGFQISTKIIIRGDAGDVFIMRWDTDANSANGYQGIVKFQSGGAIVPQGGLTAASFVHVAGDINASGGGSNPPAPYPQGPRYNNGTGPLITGASNFNGGGFFTGYWLTTGDPVTGTTQPLSNGIFVGGWYTKTTKFSMTSGTSGVYVAPSCPEPATSVSGCVYVDLNGTGLNDSGLGSAGQWGVFVINGGNLIMNSSHLTGSVALGPLATASTLQKTDISGTFAFDPSSVWDNSNLTKDFLVAGGTVSQSLAQAQTDANAASATYAAMTPSQTFGDVTGSLTITGNGGLNVIRMKSLNYNGRTLTLKGGASDSFIINVAGGWTFAQSKITLSGVTADQVVFNFPTTGPTLDLFKSSNVINGTFLAPYRSVIYHNPASFSGQIIAQNVTVHSDANLTSVSLAIAEPCLAGVTVQLANGTATSQVTTSSGYLFSDLTPATYRITAMSIPAGYSFFRANPGSLGGIPTTIAPAVVPAQNSIENVFVGYGAAAVGYNFAVKRN